MKKFIAVAILAAALAALLTGTALAAGPATPPAQSFGPGMGIHAPGTGRTAPEADSSYGMRGGRVMGRGAPQWAGQPDEVATLLGMTEEQIQVERLAGKSLAQIAADKGVGEDRLISTILDARKADLAKLVADGKLTQTQMDAMLQHMQTQIKTIVERTSAGPAFGQDQARSGMGQGFRGSRGANR